jgi:hypothetical protein
MREAKIHANEQVAGVDCGQGDYDIVEQKH